MNLEFRAIYMMRQYKFISVLAYLLIKHVLHDITIISFVLYFFVIKLFRIRFFFYLPYFTCFKSIHLNSKID